MQSVKAYARTGADKDAERILMQQQQHDDYLAGNKVQL
jgi:hypothetical protein